MVDVKHVANVEQVANAVGKKQNLAKKDDTKQKGKDVAEEKIQKKIENNYNNIC